MDIKRLQDIPPWEWPTGTDKMLLSVLRDRAANPSDRLIAAELAGDLTVIDDNLADELLAIVKQDDAPEELRATAVIALGPVLEYTYDEIDMAEEPTISPMIFNRIQNSLRKLYMDMDTPKEVRRRTLEASVRAPQDWHYNAVVSAYESHDEYWKLTAVFCMRYISGFDDHILEALNSDNPDIYYEAICAAGDWGLEDAWPHIVSIITERDDDKSLLLAAIEATVNIRPEEAADLLSDLVYSEDEDVVEAVHEAIALAGACMDEDFFNEDDDDDKTIH